MNKNELTDRIEEVAEELQSIRKSLAEEPQKNYVLIQAEVLESFPGVGVKVRLFSKTDEYTAWIREDMCWEKSS